MSPQAGKHGGNRRAGILARGNGQQIHLRMRRENPEQFHPRVSGASNDPYFYHSLQDVTRENDDDTLANTTPSIRKQKSRLSGGFQVAENDQRFEY
jgi:hypothetical protein